MLKDKTIICISHTTWEGEYTKSTVQLLSLLARNNDVIFIEYPRTVKDLILGMLGKIKAPVKQMLGISKRVTQKKTTRNSCITHVIPPPMFPTDFTKNSWLHGLLSNYNFFIYNYLLKRISKNIASENLIVITAYNPRYGLGTLGSLNESIHVYYCYDGMDSTTHHPSELAADKKLCALTDAVITSSDYLKAHKVAWNKATYVVKNGVDMSLFKNRSKKQELNSKKQQIVGYVGTLDFRFDIALIAYAAEKLPHIIFEFTGHVSYPKIIKALDHYENVRFKRAIAAHEVPEYLLRFDLGIVPYRLLAVNKNIYPLKINEYLAVGLPVVMTRFAELPEFSAFVAVSATKDEFVQKIEQELHALDQAAIDKRIAFASQNSWEERALLFGATLEAVYKEKLTLKNRTL